MLDGSLATHRRRFGFLNARLLDHALDLQDLPLPLTTQRSKAPPGFYLSEMEVLGGALQNFADLSVTSDKGSDK